MVSGGETLTPTMMQALREASLQTTVVQSAPPALAVATKADGDKPRPDLICPAFILGLSKVLAFGAKKYADRNWEKGFTYGRLFGALMRHMWAWWGGQDADPETGLSHLDHAAFCIMALKNHEVLAARSNAPVNALDDRAKPVIFHEGAHA